MNKMSEKKKMLLVGPGHGHNVDAKLRSLANQTLFDVTLLAITHDEKLEAKYPQFQYVHFDFSFDLRHPFRIVSSLWLMLKYARFKEKFDVIYVLGLGSIYIAALFLFSKKSTLRAEELWSNALMDHAKNNRGLLGICNRYILKKVDYVCQYWWGIKERFILLFPQYEKKFLQYQQSYADEYFTNEKHVPESDFVKQFLARIPEDETVCFWPRSFNSSNNHVMLLDALGIIRSKTPDLLEHFKLYLWDGNVKDEEAYNNALKAIECNQLSDNVEIVEHPFVPKNDIFAIEERSNFFVNIVNDDILSQYIMEMISSCKPFLLSNIRTFQFLNEKYDLEIELVDNNPSIIAGKITDILLNRNQPPYNSYLVRKEKCSKCFARKNVKRRWFEMLYDKLSVSND